MHRQAWKMYRAEQNFYRFRANFSDCDNFGISYAEKRPLKYGSQTRNYFIKLFYIIITGKMNVQTCLKYLTIDEMRLPGSNRPRASRGQKPIRLRPRAIFNSFKLAKSQQTFFCIVKVHLQWRNRCAKLQLQSHCLPWLIGLLIDS